MVIQIPQIVDIRSANPVFVIGVTTVIANIIFETSKQYFTTLSFCILFLTIFIEFNFLCQARLGAQSGSRVSPQYHPKKYCNL